MADEPTAMTPIVGASTQVNAQFWLNAANAAVRRECGWHVAPLITETLTMDGSGGRTLLLPSKRIKRVVTAMSDGVDVTDRVHVSQRAGMVEIEGYWSRRLGGVSITLEHGYDIDEVPDVAALILNLAKRAGSGQSPIASQSVNGASVSYLTAGGAPLSVPLLQIEKDMLRPYVLNWGT